MKFIKIQNTIFNIAYITYIHQDDRTIWVKADVLHSFSYKSVDSAKLEFDYAWTILNQEGTK